VGRIEREFPRLPGDHGRGCGRRTDHGASPSRIWCSRHPVSPGIRTDPQGKGNHTELAGDKL